MAKLTLPDLPSTVPLFPLEGALLLPGGDLPLNIFEPRYRAMVKTAMAGDRLIGLIQPCACPEKMPEPVRPFYAIGMIGRIAEFQETTDGRYLIGLHGLCRFHVQSYRPHPDGYLVAAIDATAFQQDFVRIDTLPECLTRPSLVESLRPYLQKEGLMIDWDLAASVPDERFYTLVMMVCPFSPAEKQALLEAPDFIERCRQLSCLLALSCAQENHTVSTTPC